eukprot:5320130-Pleurochrysis_carterae.AAC.1
MHHCRIPCRAGASERRGCDPLADRSSQACFAYCARRPALPAVGPVPSLVLRLVLRAEGQARSGTRAPQIDRSAYARLG